MLPKRSCISRSVLIASITAALTLALSSVTQAAWTFDYRKTITIDSSKVTANLTDFPVLISLSGDMDLRTVGHGGHVQNANGYDILFRASDNTKLDFEIEEYSSTVGGATLIAWVRIPNLSSSADTDVYIYYGNATISSSLENAAGVWDTNYQGVWHLNETVTDEGTDSGGPHKDSTSNGNNGNQVQNNEIAAGKIGVAQDFDGGDAAASYPADDSDYIEIPNSATLENIQEGNYTLEAWFNVDQLPPGGPALDENDAYYSIVNKQGEHEGLAVLFNGTVMADHWLPSSNLIQASDVTNPTPGVWYHAVIAVDRTNGTVDLYVNGVNEDTQTFTAGAAAREYGTTPWRIGIGAPTWDVWRWAMDGKIDEVRISDKVRTLEWIQTGYNNQNNPTKNVACDDGGFSCIGAEAAGPWTIPMGHAYRKKLTIDSNRVTADLLNFPVLVSLTNDMDLRTTADGGDVRNTNGYDINFRASDGTMLDYEIEKYASAVGGATLVAWVRIPNLSSTVDTDIYLYYGNPDIACSQGNSHGVWDTNFLAVHHLEEDPTGIVSGSTRNQSDMTGTNMDAADLVGGHIGDAFNFDSADTEYLTSIGTISMQAFTFSVWTNPETHPSWDVLMNFKSSGPNWRYFAVSDSDSIGYDGEGGIDWFGTGYLQENQWQHLVVTYDGTNMRAYYNGSQRGSSTAKTIGMRTGDFEIASYRNGTEAHDGIIDEVRISNIARSLDWIQTEFNNQDNPTKNPACSDNGFICLGVEEGGPWDFPWAYGYRKQLTVDSDRVTCGASIPDFPVLVSLVDPDLRTRANGGRVEDSKGYDIVFRESDGATALDFEVEKYEAATGTLVAWVRIPSLSATVDTDIYMLYGNPAVACSQADPAGVWDGDYIGVWHLGETSGNTIYDSSGNGRHGTKSATLGSGPAPNPTAQIDGGHDFVRANGEKVEMAGTASTLSLTQFTAEVWVKTPDAVVPDDYYLVTQGLYCDNDESWTVNIADDSGNENKARFAVKESTTQTSVYGTVVTDNQWHHLVGVRTATDIHIYVDGSPAGSIPDNRAGQVINSSANISIGGDPCVASEDTNGTIDEVRISDAVRSGCWIQSEYNNLKWPTKSDSPTCLDANGFICVGAEEASPPTAVQLVSFTASSRNSGILLTWETGSEIDNLGFHLYRALSAGGPYERITSRLIPGLGSSPEGKRYNYTDTGLTNGVTYYYKLEDIETTGKTEEHGPVWATPQVVEEPRGEEPEGEEESPSGSRRAVGQPELNRLNILESRTGELVLELITEGFYAIPQDDGTVRLEIPEFALTEDVGSPAVPVRRTWVPVLAGRQVNLVSVTTFDEEIFDGLAPETAGAPAIEVGRGGTIRATRQRRQRVTNRIQSFYPEHSAQLLATAFQEDVKKALVEMAPLRWDTAQNRLVLAHRLVVRLSLEGRDLAEQTTRGGRRGRRYPKPPTPEEPGHVMTRWVTTEAGLYGVDLSRLLRSRDGALINPDTLRLSRQGQSVPFHIEGSRLYFVSVGGEGNPFGHEAVYELEVGVSGEQMPVSSAVPGGAPTAFYWELIRKEEDLIYQSALVQAPDRWLWKMLFAPARESIPFDVSALVSTTELSQLKVWLQGASDFAANPDHYVQVYINDTFVGETSWNGKEAQELDFEIGAGILHDGENLLEVENLDDTDATYSMVMLNRFEVRYPRRLEAQDGYLEGSWSQSGTAEVTGVESQAHVLEKTPIGYIWLEGAEGTPSGIRFQAEAGSSHLVVSPDAVRTPTTRRVSKTNRLKTTTQQADYLLIGPRDFLGAVSPLLQLRRSQGLRAKAVAMEDITSEFGFGEENPQAIKDFLTYAYHSWDQAPRYVVLAGDGTYDFKDNLKTGVENQVPPMMVMTSYLETASDPAYAAVNGEDLLPDLAIGRLPAASVEELQTMVSKIVAFETSDHTFGGRAVLVSDNPDRAGDFVADAETLASTALSTKELEKIYLSQLGPAATRSQIVQAFNEGASLVNYIGHGGIHLWADEDIFNNDDVATLAQQGEQPLLLTMNCLNGYFHFPYLNALSEELLKANGKGAVAAFSPSGLSVNSAAHVFHRLLLEELVSGGHSRLGDAVLAAQSAYAASGALPDMIAIYHLFGDPAMKLH